MTAQPHTTSGDPLGGIDPDVYDRRWRILGVLCLPSS